MSGEGKELFSEKVSAGSRTYFFDIKESADGVEYLVISESRQVGGESYKHNRIMVFQEHLEAFNEGFNKAINFMLKKSKSNAYNVEQLPHKYPKASAPVYKSWGCYKWLRIYGV